MNWDDYDAALFDLDGVLTPTAEVHMRAWRRLFEDVLADLPGTPEPYTDQDYYDHVDGRPRYEGVAAFLASRGVTLPEGEVDDPPTARTVCGLGNRKNDEFRRVLREEGVRPYAGSVRLLEHLRDRGTAMAVVSSSRNAPDVLAAAGLEDFFPFVMHGGLAQERGLPGKPAPDTFVAAARELGAPVERSVVLEDATSGVAAGATGGFGLVVGVDRGAGAAELTRAGAGLVVRDLEELL